MITDFGHLFIETAMRSSTYSSAGVGTRVTGVFYKGVAKAVSIPVNGMNYECDYFLKDYFKYLSYFFGGLASNSTSLTLRYGDAITQGTEIISGELYLESLPYSIVCSNTFNSERKAHVISGIISNTGSDDITIRYIGLNATLYFTKSSTFNSSSDRSYSATGLLWYKELPEPVVVAPGEQYAFNLDFDVAF